MTTPPPGSSPEPTDRPEPEYPPPDPDRPAGLSGYQSYPGGPAQLGDPHAAGPPSDDPLVPAGFGGWCRRVIGVIRRSFVPLALLVTITAVINAVIGAITASMLPAPRAGAGGGVFGDLPGVGTGAAASADPGAGAGIAGVSVLGVLIGLVATAFVYSGSFFVAVEQAAGHPATAQDGLRFATGRWLPFIGWGLLGGLVVSVPVFVGAIAVGIGLAASGSIAVAVVLGLIFLLPAVYLAVAIFGSLYGVVIIERGGLGRCFELIKKRWFATFARLAVAAIIGGIYYGIAAAIAGLVGGGPASPLRAIVLAVLSIPLGVAIIGVLVVTYAELRSHEHAGVGTPRLAAELRR